MAELTIEQRLANLEKLNVKVEDGTKLSVKQTEEVVRYHAALNRVLETSKESLKLAERELAAIKAKKGVTKEEIEQKAVVAAREKELFEFKQGNEAKIRKELAITDSIRQKYATAQHKRMADMSTTEEASARIREQNIKDAADLMTRSAAGFQGMLTGMGAGLQEGIKSSADLAGLAVLHQITGMGVGVDGYRKKVLGLPKEWDDAAAGIGKSVGGLSETMRRSMQYALDPSWMERMGEAAGVTDKMYRNIGVTSDDVAKSSEQLIENSAVYREAVRDGDVATAAFLVNQAAAAEKQNITFEQSSKSLDIFTKAIGNSAAASIEKQAVLKTVAASTGKTLGSVFTDFNSQEELMALHGADALDLFARLEARSTATSVSVNKMGDAFGGQMDTFDGATKSAQTFNAMMAHTGVVMSPTELFRLDPAEKAEYISKKMSDAFKKSGVDLRTAGSEIRFELKGLAEGFNLPVADLKRHILNVDAVDKANASLRQTPMAMEETEERIKTGMTIQQRQEAGLSSLGGAYSTLAERAKPGADKFMELNDQVFGNLLTHTRNSELSLLGVAGTLETLNFGAGAITGFLGSLPAIMGAMAAVPVLGPVFAAGAGAAIGAATGGALPTPGAAPAVRVGTPTLTPAEATGFEGKAMAEAFGVQTDKMSEVLDRAAAGPGVNITLPVYLDTKEIARETLKVPAREVGK